MLLAYVSEGELNPRMPSTMGLFTVNPALLLGYNVGVQDHHLFVFRFFLFSQPFGCIYKQANIDYIINIIII